MYAFSRRGGATWYMLIEWTKSEAIQVGQVNRLAVGAQGSQFIFLINDQVVEHFEDDHLSGGLIGLARIGERLGRRTELEPVAV